MHLIVINKGIPYVMYLFMLINITTSFLLLPMEKMAKKWQKNNISVYLGLSFKNSSSSL